MEENYKVLYENQLNELRSRDTLNKRLNSLVGAYKTHMEIIEKELYCIRNNIQKKYYLQKDGKFNVYTIESFITLATTRIKKNPDFNYVLAVFDLDDFKSVNDTYGHYAGDLTLKYFTDELNILTREEIDIIGRFGGDEFVLLMENIDYETALKRINIMLQNIASKPVVYVHDTAIDKIFVKSSVGVVNYDKKLQHHNIGITDNDELTEDEIEARKIYCANFLIADQYLYDAKQHGKNQIGGPKVLQKKLTQ